jgi:hypothetical protein
MLISFVMMSGKTREAFDRTFELLCGLLDECIYIV